MSTKKKWIITVIVFIEICFVWRCFFSHLIKDTSQPLDAEVERTDAEESLHNNEEYELSSATFSYNLLQETLSFEGNRATEDTPWGVNAGKLELDEGEKCLFLTPNTGFSTGILQFLPRRIRISASIYETVREKSDGAGLLIQIYDEKDDLVKEFSFEVNTEEDKQTSEYDLDDLPSHNIRVRVVCNNGGKNDDICDWVIIDQAVIE